MAGDACGHRSHSRLTSAMPTNTERRGDDHPDVERLPQNQRPQHHRDDRVHVRIERHRRDRQVLAARTCTPRTRRSRRRRSDKRSAPAVRGVKASARDLAQRSDTASSAITAEQHLERRGREHVLACVTAPRFAVRRSDRPADARDLRGDDAAEESAAAAAEPRSRATPAARCRRIRRRARARGAT